MMRKRGPPHEAESPFPWLPPAGRVSPERRQRDALMAELEVSLARQQAMVQEMRDLSQRQVMLTQEFEHRLVNGLQLIVSLLSMQSRAATTIEASAQLTIAARRVAALGRVHRQLHLLDHQDRVEFGAYLQKLCNDLSGLLFMDGGGCAIVVEAAVGEIPTAFAIPLGFIVNEMITNAAKYAKGDIIVRFEAKTRELYSVSVTDNGPGLPDGFEPSQSKGLGMRIVRSLVSQIDGELQISAGDDGCGARFAVTFCTPSAVSP